VVDLSLCARLPHNMQLNVRVVVINNLHGDLPNQLMQLLHVNRSIHTLVFRHILNDSLHVFMQQLCKTLLHYPALTFIDMNGMTLPHSYVKHITHLLAHRSSHIQNLSIVYRCLNFDDIAPIFKSLEQNTRLTALDLSSHYYHTDAIELVDMLRVNKTLTQLNLSNMHLHSQGVQNICQVLTHHNTTLRWLDLTNNYGMTETAIAAIGECITKNKHITTLHLAHVNLNTNKIAIIAQAMKHNSTITRLDVSDNRIHDGGAFVAMADMLTVNATLTDLQIGDNYINMTGGKAFIDALCVNKSLRVLNVGYIDDPIMSDTMHLSTRFNMSSFARVFTWNTSLTSINLERNNLSSSLGALTDALVTNRRLQHLILDYNHITDSGMQAVATMLEHNTALKKLELSFNRLCEQSIQRLGDSLKKNQTITFLAMSCDSSTYQSRNYQCLQQLLDKSVYTAAYSPDGPVHIKRRGWC